MTANLHSAIYEGHVRHRRHRPVHREFAYRIFMVYLDLEEVPEVMGLHPLWSTRRRSPARFRRADYLGPAEVPLDVAVRDLVETRTGTRPAGPIRMLTHLRYWGVVENPVSFYYCFDPAGSRVETVVAEVTNTPWGDRHSYVLEGGGAGDVLGASVPKAMHVSPLMPMDQEYELSFGRPGPSLPVHIASRDERGPCFDATLDLRRTEITRSSLGRLLVTYPPMSLRVLTGIHLQAAITWARGVGYHRRPDPSGSAADDLRKTAGPAMLCPVSGIDRDSSALTGNPA